ncbi:uncharacterized protein K452DRAFT_301556 [Aplosporella prunicola CBS 121167]|uniref:Uncharacterized protein n=1 Tax=Aplosporella prunicola CBS 121167 TaxID=1176127 RepID=A0A6A6B3J2_9PEZI|nr:uncharacterized protein K452DRAFT_301556 [Aplosporella prunicola CBS 121167]KAF2137825.1 hypothetical protein K452DRAFT_301556 [Aplosporella prunicola CBS 121167]
MRGGLDNNPFRAYQAASNDVEFPCTEASPPGEAPQVTAAPATMRNQIPTGNQAEEAHHGNQIADSNNNHSANVSSGDTGQGQKSIAQVPSNPCTSCSALEKRVEALELLLHAQCNMHAPATPTTTTASPAAHAESPETEEGMKPFRHVFGDYVLEIRRVAANQEPLNKAYKSETTEQQDCMSQTMVPTAPIRQELSGESISVFKRTMPTLEASQPAAQEAEALKAPVTSQDAVAPQIVAVFQENVALQVPIATQDTAATKVLVNPKATEAKTVPTITYNTASPPTPTASKYTIAPPTPTDSQDLTAGQVATTRSTPPPQLSCASTNSEPTPQRSRLPANLPPLEQRAEKGMGSLPKSDPEKVRASLLLSRWANPREEAAPLSPPKPNKGNTSVSTSRWTSETDSSSPPGSETGSQNMGQSRYTPKNGQKGRKWNRK